ncbi:hypothetical protein [Scytonema sp. NUACC26]|uniref:hypothetical protein n=1 Tax=Scytonema sp. NUACC26 TaxID=3140176 RepID=UPI0038B2856C
MLNNLTIVLDAAFDGVFDTMHRLNKFNIVLELNNIRHLFTAPEMNPFSNQEWSPN